RTAKIRWTRAGPAESPPPTPSRARDRSQCRSIRAKALDRTIRPSRRRRKAPILRPTARGTTRPTAADPHPHPAADSLTGFLSGPPGMERQSETGIPQGLSCTVAEAPASPAAIPVAVSVAWNVAFCEAEPEGSVPVTLTWSVDWLFESSVPRVHVTPPAGPLANVALVPLEASA